MDTKLLLDPVHNVVLNFENGPVVLEELIAQLCRIGVFTFEEGAPSLSVDFRKAFTYPTVLAKMAELLWERLGSCQCQHILGVPQTGLVLATAISVKRMVPMLVDSGGALTGDFFFGQRVALIADVLAGGAKVLDSIALAEKEGLLVSDVVVFLDERQGGSDSLRGRGVHVHPVMTPSDLF